MAASVVQGGLRENFFRVANRMEALSGIIDPQDPDTLHYARAALLEIVTDLTNMAVSGQKMDGESSQESTLVTEIFGLLEQSKNLLGHIHKAIEIQSRLGTGRVPSNDTNRQPEEESGDSESDDDSDSESDDDKEASPDNDPTNNSESHRVDRLVQANEEKMLSREEIGKMLVLTSRAYKTQIITPNQRAFLKNQIIARYGMLRVVLQFPTLESIMAALKTISSSVDE